MIRRGIWRGYRSLPPLAQVLTYVLCGTASAQEAEEALLKDVDHLVYATPDLQQGIRQIERLFGVKVVPGGQHADYGTRNALVSLGGASYLEIIGPDPSQPDPSGPRIFGIDELDCPRLVTWAAKGQKISEIAAANRATGLDLGAVSDGSRRRPDGTVLRWQLTDPDNAPFDGVVPFLIDWGHTPQPAASLPACCELLQLRLTHPDAAAATRALRAMHLGLVVMPADRAGLAATIRTPAGIVTLE